ncbi:MAG TPA: cytochrome c oxidase subunit 3 [Polyangiaceae bacterium]|jgi:cytochrome c oxidase subunit 3|nr:cytochrome c oxidase subunit 3 [Polyangiaceae bacterium]
MDQERPAAPKNALPAVVADRQLGLRIFFASLCALFIATIAAVLLTRAQSESWPSERLVELRPALFVSTLLLGLTSFAFVRAEAAIKLNRERGLLYWLWAAGGFAFLFLFTQSLNLARAWQAAGALKNLYAFTFTLLTGVHGLHVLGGFVPLALVIRGARRHEYSSSNSYGVQFCAQYWHFIGVVWLFILLVLFTG